MAPNAKFCDSCGTQVVGSSSAYGEPSSKVRTPQGQTPTPPPGYPMGPPKQLYRSRGNRVIAGVCGGIGEYYNTDPTLIRLLFIIAFFSGIGLIAYIIAIIIVPESPYDPWEEPNRK